MEPVVDLRKSKNKLQRFLARAMQGVKTHMSIEFLLNSEIISKTTYLKQIFEKYSGFVEEQLKTLDDKAYDEFFLFDCNKLMDEEELMDKD